MQGGLPQSSRQAEELTEDVYQQLLTGRRPTAGLYMFRLEHLKFPQKPLEEISLEKDIWVAVFRLMDEWTHGWILS